MPQATALPSKRSAVFPDPRARPGPGVEVRHGAAATAVATVAPTTEPFSATSTSSPRPAEQHVLTVGGAVGLRAADQVVGSVVAAQPVLADVADEVVVAGAADEDVGVRAAEQHVGAVVAEEHVVAVAAVGQVGAVAGAEVVGAAAAAQQVVAVTREDAVAVGRRWTCRSASTAARSVPVSESPTTPSRSRSTRPSITHDVRRAARCTACRARAPGSEPSTTAKPAARPWSGTTPDSAVGPLSRSPLRSSRPPTTRVVGAQSSSRSATEEASVAGRDGVDALAGDRRRRRRRRPPGRRRGRR